ncbi:hypothetical protein ACU8KH_05935 [Lachancea thermotolerans]
MLLLVSKPGSDILAGGCLTLLCTFLGRTLTVVGHRGLLFVSSVQVRVTCDVVDLRLGQSNTCLPLISAAKSVFGSDLGSWWALLLGVELTAATVLISSRVLLWSRASHAKGFGVC